MEDLVRKKYNLNNIYLLCIIAFNLIYFCVVASTGNMRYESNDDVVMCLIANGGYSGSPDCHLVYQNAIWGFFLTILYAITDAIEWYTVCFVLLHIVSMTIIVYHIISTVNHVALKLFYLISLYILWGCFIMSFQFTTTAAVTCLAGVILMQKDTTIPQVFGGVLILIASFIRIESALLVGILFIPYVCIQNKFEWKKYLKYLAVCVAIIMGLFGNQLFYQSPKWKYYAEYNYVRGHKIHDNPNLMNVDESVLCRYGIDKNDWIALCEFFPDPEIFTLPVLKGIANEIQTTPITAKISNIRQLGQYRMFLILLLLLTCFLFAGTENRYTKLGVGVTFLLAMSVIGLLSLSHMVKLRVFFSVLMTVMTIFAILPYNNNVYKNMIPLCFILLLFTLKISKKAYQTYRLNDYIITSYINEQKPLLEYLPEDAFLVSNVNTDVTIEALNPFKIKQDMIYRIYPRGWLTYFPARKDAELSNRCLLNDDVYIFSSIEDMECLLIREQLKRHYDIDTHISVISQNEKSAIVKILSNIEPLVDNMVK